MSEILIITVKQTFSFILNLLMQKFFFQGAKYPLSLSCANTKEVYSDVCSILNRKEEELILSFNNIFLSKSRDYELISLGYAPTEYIYVEFSSKTKSFFSISSFNHQYVLEIDKYTNVFSIKDHFSQQFFTVPQNIIIKYENRVLSDNEMIINYSTTKDNPFEITVNDDYFLVRTYFGSFTFVCMQKNATVGNLKDTLLIYSQKTDEIKTNILYSPSFISFCNKNGISDENSIDEQELSSLSEKVPLFEFIQKDPDTDSTYNVNMEVTDNDNNITISIQCKFYFETSVYSVNCLIEKQLRIERNLFYLVDSEKRSKLSPNDMVTSRKNNDIVANIFKVLYARKNNKIKKYSYLTKIKRKDIGFIINNQFAFADCLLINFMNDSDTPDNATEIIIKKPQYPCHVLTFINKDKPSESGKKYIVLDNYTENSIMKTYLKTNDIVNGRKKSNEFQYELKISFTCNFCFTFKSGKTYSNTIILHKANPRIIDFLNEVYDELQAKIFKKYEVADVIIEDKKMSFWDPLCSSYKNDLFIRLFGMESQEWVFILNIADKNNIFLPFYEYNKNYSAHEIIFKFCLNKGINNYDSLNLFADFNLLEPFDIPSLFKLEYFLTLSNKDENTKTFFITNESGVRATLHISESTDDFSELATIINSMFKLTESQTKFTAKINKKEYKLHSKFHAGSFPDQTEFNIQYSYEKQNRITFNFKGKVIVLDINVDNTIESIKSIFIKESKLLKIAKNSIDFSFYGFILSHEKPFSFYKIPSKAVISVDVNEKSIPIYIAIPEKDEFKEYIFNYGDTIEDVSNHYKSILSPDFEMNFYLKSDRKNKLNLDIKLEKDMNIYIHCKRILIKCEGSLEKKEFKVSEILTVLDAIKYIKTKLSQRHLFIYTKNKDDKCYEPAEYKKRLMDFDCQLYAHLYVPEFKFNYPIFSKNEFVSELNTVYWLKKNFISNAVLISPENIQLTYHDKAFSDSDCVRKLSERKITIEIINHKAKITPVVKKITFNTKDPITKTDIKPIIKHEPKEASKPTKTGPKEIIKVTPLKNVHSSSNSSLLIKPVNDNNPSKDKKKIKRPHSSIKPSISPVEMSTKNDSKPYINDDSKPYISDGSKPYISDDSISFHVDEEFKILDSEVISKFKIIQNLGKKSFILTNKAIYPKIKDKFFALKMFDNKIFAQDKEIQMSEAANLYREYCIINDLRHENIIKSYGIFNGDLDQSVKIVFEYCPHNLKEVVSRLNIKEKINIITEISQALKFIRGKGYVGINMKPENVLLDSDKHVKLSGFHFTHPIGYDYEAFMVYPKFIEANDYIAPEILNEEEVSSEKADVYSFGVLLCFILTGEQLKYSPFDVKSGKMPKIPSSIAPGSAKLIKKCMSFKPNDRPSFVEICNYIEQNRNRLILC